MTNPCKTNHSGCVTKWLLFCCGMIAVMALLGAVTRLTQSGLSITDWKPIVGAIPPLNDADWYKSFASYQQIPQYQILNRGMTLDEFKGIFFWEWVHRLWGRLIGIVFALPLIVFIAQKKISRALAIKLALILALGALQAFIGWFMVQSGLEVRTSVSPFRLALHLGFALLLYALVLDTALQRIFIATRFVNTSLRRHGWIAIGFLSMTIIWGAFVAGLRAGEVYNTWPSMEGGLMPEASWTLDPLWRNAFENLGLVQFIHRWIGPTTMIVLLSWVWRCWQSARDEDKKWLGGLAVMALAQVMLGITTLLSHVDIFIATCHQAGAIALLTLVLINLRRVSGTQTLSK